MSKGWQGATDAEWEPRRLAAAGGRSLASRGLGEADAPETRVPAIREHAATRLGAGRGGCGFLSQPYLSAAGASRDLPSDRGPDLSAGSPACETASCRLQSPELCVGLVTPVSLSGPIRKQIHLDLSRQVCERAFVILWIHFPGRSGVISPTKSLRGGNELGLMGETQGWKVKGVEEQVSGAG